MKYFTLVFLLLGLLTIAQNVRAYDYRNQSCLDNVCSRLPHIACNELGELGDIAAACSNYSVSMDCFDFATSKVSTFEKNTWPKLRNFLLACHETWDVSCQEQFYKRMSHFEGDSAVNAQRVARACQRVEGRCVEQVCGRIGHLSCRRLNQLENVAQSCRGHW